jgi:hypothetical protein
MTDHERAESVIEGQLGGKPVSRSFKLPFGSAKIVLHGLTRRQHLDNAAEEPEEYDDLGVREVSQDQKLDLNRPIINWGPLNWNRRQVPCIHCNRPGLLLDDAGRPAHKICAETALAKLLRNPERQAS